MLESTLGAGFQICFTKIENHTRQSDHHTCVALPRFHGLQILAQLLKFGLCGACFLPGARQFSLLFPGAIGAQLPPTLFSFLSGQVDLPLLEPHQKTILLFLKLGHLLVYLCLAGLNSGQVYLFLSQIGIMFLFREVVRLSGLVRRLPGLVKRYRCILGHRGIILGRRK